MKYVENSNVLVTGGAGFIGSALVESLLEHGNTVTVLDNLFSGKVSNIPEQPNLSFICGDITCRLDCIDACKAMDYVFHQAAVGSVPRSIANPFLTTEVNVMGTLNMLIAARDAGVKRFVYASSSSVYGDSAELPKVEERIGNPLSPYAISKRCNELHAMNFQQLYGLETVGLRYFNVYGRRQDPDSAYAAVIPKWAKELIAHQSPTIYGDGSNSRDFTYVDDVVQANHLAALAPAEATGTAYNVAGGKRTTMRELFLYLRTALAQNDDELHTLDFAYAPERVGDVAHSLASTDKARLHIGYVPQFSFADGIREAAKWYWDNRTVEKGSSTPVKPSLSPKPSADTEQEPERILGA